MTYEVRFDDPAEDDLRCLPRSVQHRVLERIEGLATDPRPVGAQRLVGRLAGLLKLRVGDYRVAYHVDDGARLVTVVEIGHRRDIYDRLVRRW